MPGFMLRRGRVRDRSDGASGDEIGYASGHRRPTSGHTLAVEFHEQSRTRSRARRRQGYHSAIELVRSQILVNATSTVSNATADKSKPPAV